MNTLDTAKAVLAKASLLDQTFANPDLGIAVAWAEILGDVNRDDALSVVATHYAAETRRILPADVLAGVKRIRNDRLRRYGNSEPEYDGDDVHGGIEAIRDTRRRIANGELLEQPTHGFGPRRDDVARLVQQTARALPRVPRVEA
jgi:hypothetical protein